MAIQESTAVDQEYQQSTTGRGHRFVQRLASVEPYLWAVVVVALLADVFTTTYGLAIGFTEGNPAMAIAIESAGVAALIGAKLLAVSVAFAVRRRMDDSGVVVPLGLGLPWAVAALTNAALLL